MGLDTQVDEGQRSLLSMYAEIGFLVTSACGFGALILTLTGSNGSFPVLLLLIGWIAGIFFQIWAGIKSLNSPVNTD